MLSFSKSLLLASGIILFASSCSDDDDDTRPGTTNSPVFLIIDEESIDNGNPPNNFTETDVNDPIAAIGLRQQLAYFAANIGDTITLYTGDVGDEGWFAMKSVPSAWQSAGPTVNGTDNYIQAGPGLGSGTDPEDLLDNVLNVTPLRATGLKMLTGKTVLALVYDSDVSINYSPLQANLMGENLGLVGFTVVDVTTRTDGSSSSLPRVRVKIENADNLKQETIYFFSNAPVPTSSSEPYDVIVPASVSEPVLLLAP